MTTEILPHVLVLRPPFKITNRLLEGSVWTPWLCLCGAGGTGGDEAAAIRQYEAHL